VSADEQSAERFPVHARAQRDARGYAWETFQRGHFLSIRHGAYSQRVIAPLAEQLIEDLLVDAPDLAAPRYRHAVSAWARAETRCALLTFWADQREIVDPEDGAEPRSRLLKELRSAESEAARMRSALGLDPTSHARLVLERAEARLAEWDISEVVAAGRSVIEAKASEWSSDGAR
jgi:hypothetical protein